MPKKWALLAYFLGTLFLLNNFSLAEPAETKESVSLEDRIIGTMFKAAARTFILAADIERLKSSNIKKLDKMDEVKFRRRYIKVYTSIKDVLFLKSRYGISENMTRKEAIGRVQSLQKKEIYEIIDALPDAIIAREFRIYLYDKKQEISKSNICAQISRVWNKIIKKMEGE